MPLARLGEKIPTKNLDPGLTGEDQLHAGLTKDFSKADSESQEWWLFSWLAQDQLLGQSQMAGDKQGNDSKA